MTAIISECYLCKSKQIKLIHPRVRDRDDIQVLECTHCNLVFLNRQDHVSFEFYEESGMHDYAVFDPEILAEGEISDTKRRVNVLKDLVKNKTYLDFGCGTGQTAKDLASYSRLTAVIEPDRKMRQYIKKKLDLTAFESTNEAIQHSKIKYDVISLFHVLEHLKNPREELKEISRLLNPGGQILVEIPSADDALLSLYQSEPFKNFTYWSCHLYLFNPQNLVQLIHQAGLVTVSVEQVQRYPLANHLYWLSQGKPGGHLQWASMQNSELDKAYEKTLAQLGKCDTLVAKITLPSPKDGVT